MIKHTPRPWTRAGNTVYGPRGAGVVCASDRLVLFSADASPECLPAMADLELASAAPDMADALKVALAFADEVERAMDDPEADEETGAALMVRAQDTQAAIFAALNKAGLGES